MRVIIEIDEGLVGPVEEYARAQGITFDELVNQTLANEFGGRKVDEPAIKAEAAQ